jgi:hypothetical protein
MPKGSDPQQLPFSCPLKPIDPFAKIAIDRELHGEQVGIPRYSRTIMAGCLCC